MFIADNVSAVEIIRVRGFNLIGKSPLRFTDSVTYAFLLIDANSIVPELIPVTHGAELESRFINYYRNALVNKYPDSISYEQFWKPVAGKLNLYKRLYISADGIYNQINLIHHLHNFNCSCGCNDFAEFF